MELTQANTKGFRSKRRGPGIAGAAAIDVISGIAISTWPVGLMAAGEPVDKLAAERILDASTPVAVAFMLSVLTLKITAFVLGYLIVRLGHDTLIKGITGQIDFGFSGSGFKAKLKAASPGGLFVLMGAAIIIWGLAVQKPMEIKAPASSPQATDSDPALGGEQLRRPPLPQ